MNWKPILPRVEWPNLIAHIPSMVLYWSVYIVGLYVILSFGHGIVVQMFEYIPEAEYSVVIVAAVAVLMALLVVYSQFVANKKDELVKEKEAKLEGTVYDTVNKEISAKMFWGYPVLAVIAAGILTVVVMLILNEVEISQYATYVSTQTRVVLVGIVAELIAFAIVDKYFLRSAMDGLFYEKVEEPATKKFLDGTLIDSVAEAAETVMSATDKLQSYLDAGFTEAEALERMKQQ